MILQPLQLVHGGVHHEKGLERRSLRSHHASDDNACVTDEPTAGLDPLIQQAFFDVVREAKGEAMTVLERLSGLTAHEAKQQLLERSGGVAPHLRPLWRQFMERLPDPAHHHDLGRRLSPHADGRPLP